MIYNKVSRYLLPHQVIQSYLDIRGIPSSRIERVTKVATIDLGDGTNGVGQTVHCLCPLTSEDPWKQIGNQAVVHVSFEDNRLHIKYSRDWKYET